MITLLTLFIATIVFWCIAVVSNRCSAFEAIGVIGCFLSAVILVAALITIPITRMETLAAIDGLAALTTTIDASRAQGVTIENAALTREVATANRSLAEAKYYNKTLFDIWIPDQIESIQPIR